MRCFAICFLIVGAFLLEWHERGISAAWRELKVYWSTRPTLTAADDEEAW